VYGSRPQSTFLPETGSVPSAIQATQPATTTVSEPETSAQRRRSEKTDRDVSAVSRLRRSKSAPVLGQAARKRRSSPALCRQAPPRRATERY